MSLHLNKARRFASIAIAVPLLLVLTGCGPKPDPTGTLTGTVTADGKPAGNLKIAFYNAETGQPISATVNESASYKLTEVPFGDYEVCVFSKPVFSNEPLPPDSRIPKKLLSRKTSDLTVSVDSEDEVQFDIVLK